LGPGGGQKRSFFDPHQSYRLMTDVTIFF
jgi:hypothetical protein